MLVTSPFGHCGTPGIGLAMVAINGLLVVVSRLLGDEGCDCANLVQVVMMAYGNTSNETL